MKSLKNIETLIKNFEIQPNSQMKSKVLDEALEIQRNSHSITSGSDFWKNILKTKNTRFATSAIIIIAIFISIEYLYGSFDFVTPAFADILEKIYQTKSVTFTETVYNDNQGSPFVSKRMLIEPGILRTEITGHGITIKDFKSGRYLQYSPFQKTAYLRQGIGMSYAKKMLDYLDWISKLHVKEGKFIRNETLNGIQSNVFVIKYDYETITVWADRITNLPMRIESVNYSNPDKDIIVPYICLSESDFGGRNISRSLTLSSDRGDHRGIQKDEKRVLSDFNWNFPLDPSLFSLIPPDGYAIEKIQHDYSEPNENFLIEALAFWAEMSSGSFPSDINLLGDANEIKPKLIEKYHNGGKPKQEFNLAYEKLTRILNGLMFVQQLKADRNWYYAGNGVKLGEAEIPICWYHLENSEKYNIIYGDLSVKAVNEKDLPK